MMVRLECTPPRPNEGGAATSEWFVGIGRDKERERVKPRAKREKGREFALNVQCEKADLGNGEVSSGGPKCERLHNDGWSPAGCLIRKRLEGTTQGQHLP